MDAKEIAFEIRKRMVWMNTNGIPFLFTTEEVAKAVETLGQERDLLLEATQASGEYLSCVAHLDIKVSKRSQDRLSRAIAELLKFDAETEGTKP